MHLMADLSVFASFQSHAEMNAPTGNRPSPSAHHLCEGLHSLPREGIALPHDPVNPVTTHILSEIFEKALEIQGEQLN